MLDFKIIYARHKLRVRTVAPVRNFLPPSLIVTGFDLDKTSEIFFNGIKTPEFAILSSTRVIARIPDAVVGKELKDLSLFSTVQASKRDALVQLKLNSMASASGIERLIQTWILVFMTNPGSDVFQKNSGGGGPSIIGRTTDDQGTGVLADLTLAINRTKSEILKKQSEITRIPLEERLSKAEIGNIKFDKSAGALSAVVTLTNMAGDNAEVLVG